MTKSNTTIRRYKGPHRRQTEFILRMQGEVRPELHAAIFAAFNAAADEIERLTGWGLATREFRVGAPEDFDKHDRQWRADHMATPEQISDLCEALGISRIDELVYGRGAPDKGGLWNGDAGSGP